MKKAGFTVGADALGGPCGTGQNYSEIPGVVANSCEFAWDLYILNDFSPGCRGRQPLHASILIMFRYFYFFHSHFLLKHVSCNQLLNQFLRISHLDRNSPLRNRLVLRSVLLPLSAEIFETVHDPGDGDRLGGVLVGDRGAKLVLRPQDRLDDFERIGVQIVQVGKDNWPPCFTMLFCRRGRPGTPQSRRFCRRRHSAGIRTR